MNKKNVCETTIAKVHPEPRKKNQKYIEEIERRALRVEMK